jgi:hypothetical protein
MGLNTFGREEDLLKRARARGLTMTRERSLEPKYTVEREGVFKKRHMTLDKIEDLFSEPTDRR